jgi:putative membrane protein insertion efficiency factor
VEVPPFRRPTCRDVAIGVIRAYKIFISPLFGPRCRFYPSCSSYTMDAIKVYGLGHGTILSIKRILKCHPWHPGGYDPVR